MVNWTNVLSNKVGRNAVVKFATGELSRDNLLKTFSGKPEASDVRQLVRTKGAQESRRIARKALRRRNLI
jgi:hypothetical protein